jgi:DMSO/TMAO reductase YedYZ molybdopterin-dependent catalytic subunit
MAATLVVTAAGAGAAVASPTQGIGAAWPSVAAGVVAALALWAIDRWAHAAPPAPLGVDRRRLVAGIAATALAGIVLARVGHGARGRFSVSGERDALVVPDADDVRPALPAGLEADVAGITPLVTANADFYRIDTALTIPAVPVADWRLRIHGMVTTSFELTFEELTARPLVETDATLCCVSNEVGGGLVGTARWRGVRLDDLLAEAGVHADADQVVGRSVDGFTAGFPVAALDGRDALVAIAMNGEPLPVEHGYPARLVVPGLYGYVSATKWLAEIELTRFDAFEGYWVPRGWSAQGPIKTQSRIDTPRGSVGAGTVPVAGVAWAGVRGIARVEVRVDDGPWHEARLGDELAATTWRQWWWPWETTPGRHVVAVRATDGTGATQPEERSAPAPDGATGWHTVGVTVDG